MGYYTAALAADSWYGIYYQGDSPTITVTNIAPNAGAPIGASKWWVLDSKGATVASGTCTPADTTITVATNGIWASGGTVGVDAYHFYTDTTAPPVNGGGVATWNKAAAPSAAGWDVEIWWGVVTATGAHNLYVALGAVEEPVAIIDEFGTGATPTWSQIAEAGPQANASSTTVAFPSLTATAAGQLYVGAAQAPTAFSAGSSTGFTYNSSRSPTVVAYNPNCAAGAVAPTYSISTAGASNTAGVILAASAGTISHVGTVGSGGNQSSGIGGYTVSVTPVNVGDVLVFCHIDTAGNSTTGFPAPAAQGCLFYVCPSTRLFNPTAQGYTRTTQKFYALTAWMGVAQDRAFYNDSIAASTIATTYAADPCFNGAWLDTARPRIPWFATEYAGTGLPTWSTTVSNMVAAGLTGWAYELPSNEPDNAGEVQATIISNYNTARSDVLASDSTAKCMGFCSAGVPEASSYSVFSAILAGISGFDHVSVHDENSVDNQGDLLTLRQKWSELASLVGASPNPAAVIWSTETGMLAAYYGVYHPRRHAAQVTKFLLVREMYGYRKEFVFFFGSQVETGTGTLPTGFVEWPTGGDGAGGSIRMGGYAAHIMSEALYGTACSPTSPPTQLSFGPTGSIGDSLFLGLHYTSASANRDVVVLATNGIGHTANETVTLQVSSTTGLTVWNGVGQDVTASCTVSGQQVTVPVDDLLTYVFLPLSSTVTVVDTGSKALSVLNQGVNLVAVAPSFVNEASTAVSAHGLNWGNSQAYSYGVAPALPYSDSTIPATLTASGWPSAQAISGFALKSIAPWNPTQDPTPVTFSIIATIGGTQTTIYSYTNSTATSVAAPTSPCPDTCARTTYWDHTFAWAATLSPSGDVTAVELSVTATSYAGEPDTAAATGQPFGALNQGLGVANFQICQAPVSSGTRSWTAPTFARLATG